MESIILLNYNENTRKVEEEEQSRFIRDVIESIGLPVNDIWDENGYLSVDKKTELKSILSTFGITVLLSCDGRVEIYNREENDDVLIGAWEKPEYVLKRDYKARDPKKKLYLEMKVNYWSIFQEQE